MVFFSSAQCIRKAYRSYNAGLWRNALEPSRDAFGVYPPGITDFRKRISRNSRGIVSKGFTPRKTRHYLRKRYATIPRDRPEGSLYENNTGYCELSSGFVWIRIQSLGDGSWRYSAAENFDQSELGKIPFVASALFNMSFNGTSVEAQKKAREDLHVSLDEIEKLSEEERISNSCSLDDLRLELGIYRPEEEREESNRLVLLDSVRTYEQWLLEMKRICSLGVV